MALREKSRFRVDREGLGLWKTAIGLGVWFMQPPNVIVGMSQCVIPLDFGLTQQQQGETCESTLFFQLFSSFLSRPASLKLNFCCNPWPD